jgi:hypothetical protein
VSTIGATQEPLRNEDVTRWVLGSFGLAMELSASGMRPWLAEVPVIGQVHTVGGEAGFDGGRQFLGQSPAVAGSWPAKTVVRSNQQVRLTVALAVPSARAACRNSTSPSPVMSPRIWHQGAGGGLS